MSKINRTWMAAAILVVGCYSGMDGEDLQDQRRAETEEIVENLLDAGFPKWEIGVLADGTVYVGDDAVVTLEASREMVGTDSNGFRQYRTNNVVDTTTVQTICINPDSNWESNGTMLAALDAAIANFNDQGLQFTMGRDGAGCSVATADAVIVANLTGGSGGSAGFPSGGLPYDTINVGSGVASDGLPVATHVTQHELGHCVGFRHSDFYDRSISCGGSPTDEGDGGVGAVHIPGTPTTAVFNGSVMNSCYNSGSDGVWTASDIAALDCLYASGSCAPPPPPAYDVNLDTQTGLAGGNNEETQYGPYDLTGFDALRVQISGGSGDADLYVRFGAQPTTSNWNCRPYTAGNNEICEFNPSQDGLYYVMVRGFDPYDGVTLTVDGAGGTPPPPAEVCDNGSDDDGDGDVDCADSDCASDPACAPPAEVCDNGVDDDGDGSTDCDDSDCASDPACFAGPTCGNGVCEVGESCDGRNGTLDCEADCPGRTNGRPSNRFCFVDGVCEGPGC